MNRETAVKVLGHAEAMLEQGNRILNLINNNSDEDERKRYHDVLGTAVANIDLDLLEPLYKQFPDLRPKDMEEIKGSNPKGGR